MLERTIHHYSERVRVSEFEARVSTTASPRNAEGEARVSVTRREIASLKVWKMNGRVWRRETKRKLGHSETRRYRVNGATKAETTRETEAEVQGPARLIIGLTRNFCNKCQHPASRKEMGCRNERKQAPRRSEEKRNETTETRGKSMTISVALVPRPET